jgi:hypothetical protein
MAWLIAALAGADIRISSRHSAASFAVFRGQDRDRVGPCQESICEHGRVDGVGAGVSRQHLERFLQQREEEIDPGHPFDISVTEQL